MKGFMHAKMERWATWYATGSLARGMGYGSSANCGACASGQRSSAPGLAEECIRLHQQLGALPPDLRQAVEVFYLGQGSMRAKAQQLGCSAPTLYDRVHRAHALLQGQWAPAPLASKWSVRIGK